MATLASSAKGAVMKTDAVLTMNEYLHRCCAVWKPVTPPVSDARHIPIAAEGDLDLRNEAHGCRCDRWGHPCAERIESRHDAVEDAAAFGEVTK